MANTPDTPVFTPDPILQVFWCHPTTDSATRADMIVQYFEFLEHIRDNIDLPDGWKTLQCDEILAFAHSNGQHGLRTVDEHQSFSFSECADETYCLQKRYHFPGWHPNAVHLCGDLFSMPGNPVPYATMVQFAHAIRGCCHGGADVRIIGAETSFPKPEKQGCETRDAKRMRSSIDDYKTEKGEDGISRETVENPGMSLSASAWQSAALKFDPKFVHLILDPTGNHGTHTFGTLMERCSLARDSCAYVPMNPRLVERGYGQSPTDGGVSLSNDFLNWWQVQGPKQLRPGSCIDSSLSLVVRVRTDLFCRNSNYHIRDSNLSGLAELIEEKKRQFPATKPWILIVRGPFPGLRKNIGSRRADYETLHSSQWRAWTFDGPGYQAGLRQVPWHEIVDC